MMGSNRQKHIGRYAAFIVALCLAIGVGIAYAVEAITDGDFPNLANWPTESLTKTDGTTSWDGADGGATPNGSYSIQTNVGKRQWMEGYREQTLAVPIPSGSDIALSLWFKKVVVNPAAMQQTVGITLVYQSAVTVQIWSDTGGDTGGWTTGSLASFVTTDIVTAVRLDFSLRSRNSNGAQIGAWFDDISITYTGASIDLTADDGVSRPGASTACNNSTENLVDQFLLSTGGGTANVTDIEITGTNIAGNVTGATLYRDDNNNGLLDGDTLLDTATFAGNVATFTGLTEAVDVGTNYLILYDILDGAADGVTVTSQVTDVVSDADTLTINATQSAAVTIDAATVRVTGFVASDGEDGQSTLTWTNPTPGDLAEVLVKRKVGSYPTDETDGVTVLQNLAPVEGGANNIVDSPLTNGTTYFYAVFTRDNCGNWYGSADAGFNADTGSPVGAVCVHAAPTVTVSAPEVVEICNSACNTYTFTVTNNDSASCADEIYDISFSAPPANWSNSYLGGSLTLAAGATSGAQTFDICANASAGGSYNSAIFADAQSGDDAQGSDTDPTTSVDTTPPTLVGMGISAAPGDTTITLSWTNLADYAEILMIRKDDPTWPVDHLDTPTLIINETPPASAAALDGGLTNGNTYNYVMYVRDSCGNWNDGESVGDNAVSSSPVSSANTLTILDPGQPAGRNLTVGAMFEVVQRIRFSVDSASAFVSSITIQETGSALASDIVSLQIWTDDDQDGAVGGELLLGTAVDNGDTTYTLSGLGIRVDAGADVDVLVVVSLSAIAVPGREIITSLNAGYILVLAPDGVDESNVPFGSNTFPIIAPSGGDGFLLRRTNKVDQTCNACHNLLTHNAVNTTSSKWGGTWGSNFTCQTCHTPHNTRNIYLIKERITWDGTSWGAGVLDTGPIDDINSPTTGVVVKVLGISDPNNPDPTAGVWSGQLADSNDGNFTGVCEVCHSITNQHRNLASQPDPDFTHNNSMNCVTQCHKHENAFKGTGECTTCHNVQRDRTLGIFVAGGRRQVTGAGGDYTDNNSGHLVNGNKTVDCTDSALSGCTPERGPEIVTKWDCIVCHAEGSATGNPDGTYHNDAGGLVNLRNVDTGVAGWAVDNDAWTNATLTDMDNFCMTCHDADGASAFAVNATDDGIDLAPSAALALAPFNSNDNFRNAWDIFTTRTGVLNVFDQFDTTNPSHHAVRGQRYTTNPEPGSIPDSTFTGTWNDTSTLHCSDCHLNDLNAHGARNAWYMLDTNAGNFDEAPTWGSGSGGANTSNYVCFKCHQKTSYANADDGTGGDGGSRVDHSINGGHWNESKNSLFGYLCLNCHGGDEFGGMHGRSGTYTTDGGTTTKYRFMPGGWMMWYPAGGDWASTSTGTCYLRSTNTWSNCTQHSGGNRSLDPEYTRATSY